MTREEIIELAKQHGAVTEVLAMGRSDGVLFTPLELEAFFHAAQALEREACAKVCEETDVHTFTYCGIAHEDGGITLTNAAAAIRNRN